MLRFLCLYIPHFVAWAMARAQPVAPAHPLTPARPLLVYHNGRVLSASCEAWAAGVQPGWALERAQALVPDARAVPFDGSLVTAAWDTVLQILYDLTPQIETVRHGSSSKHRKRAQNDNIVRQAAVTEYGRAMTQYLPEEALVPWLREWNAGAGVADDRATAELAALTALPGEINRVPVGRSRAFLRAVPMSVLSETGVSEATLERLSWFGWHSVAHLRRLTHHQLALQFPEADVLFRYAQTGDTRPVATYSPPLTLSARYAFEESAHEPWEWEPVLRWLLDQTHQQLEGRTAQSLTIVADTGGGKVKVQRLLREATNHLPGLRLASQQAMEMLLRQALGAGLDVGALDLQLLEVHLGHLAQPVSVQGQLFGTSRPAVQKAIQSVEGRFPGALQRIVTVNAHAYLPEESFRLEPVALTVGAMPGTNRPDAKMSRRPQSQCRIPRQKGAQGRRPQRQASRQKTLGAEPLGLGAV
jgi:hypothetical protein